MQNSRENFGSRIAFILAMSGSAIGLGNIWRFPYIVGEHGGAAFIIVYLLFSFLISLPMFFAEGVIGKKARHATYKAMEHFAPGTQWKQLSWLVALTSFLIVSYYSVVGGWSIDYLLQAAFLGLNCSTEETTTAMFATVSGSPIESVMSFTVFLSLTSFIVLMGVKKGIERFTKLTIPILFVLIVVVMIYGLFLPGAGEGVEYLMKPDFSKLDAKALGYALGQSFYSMSLGVGCVLIYSSYMKQGDNLMKAGVWTSIFDSMFALLAGFAVMPAVFAAGLRPSAGPALVFETIPYIFSVMGEKLPVLSNVMVVLFFLAILTAALTSSISMLEVTVNHVMERLRMSRKKSVAIVYAGAWVLGMFCALSFGKLSDVTLGGKTVFGICDMLSSNYLMVFGAFCYAIFAGWKMKKEDVTSEIGKPFHFIIKWIAPIVIVLIFATNFIL